jgi:hypothetical protein
MIFEAFSLDAARLCGERRVDACSFGAYHRRTPFGVAPT